MSEREYGDWSHNVIGLESDRIGRLAILAHDLSSLTLSHSARLEAQ